ncbi:hypothetical protein TcasGA2_TC002923 [Tribolium castaneum]|uniref:Uncharacterized protein n=1 Tax=Tribolium castaneum TaxID=7070 RepID=D6WHC8_TRICA|nr:hypothetical protein TcasGA2_TC002923 [Tribolium castaneum]
MSPGRQLLARAAITCLNTAQLETARIPSSETAAALCLPPDGRYNTTRCQVVCELPRNIQCAAN